MPRFAVRTGVDLGRAIRELRQTQGLSQAELAELTGLSPAYVSKIESGRTSSLLEHELRVLRRLGARVTIEGREGREGKHDTSGRREPDG